MTEIALMYWDPMGSNKPRVQNNPKVDALCAHQNLCNFAVNKSLKKKTIFAYILGDLGLTESVRWKLIVI